ncbi:fibrobacter succinogenes major paralogous domain-containing protein [Flavobacterium sp. XS2P39]|uniref:fibrobacter succinogenes major paralogous domain-containing protein n=1 Tax=Flavobacterium sp. XS2P39 TaxID=3401725 RepID=UPI003AAFF653
MKTHLKNQTLLILIVSFFIVSCSTDTVDSLGLTTTNEVAKIKDPKINVPTLTTTAASVITATTANSGGMIISAKGTISAKGVVWSTLQNPTIDLITKTTDGTGLGGFTSSLTSLNPATTYYVRAYATNVNGTGYGNQVSYTTLTLPFPTVTIGTQTWTNANLDVTTYRDGTTIPQVTVAADWAGLTTGAWCYYNNDPANGAVYGKLYNWYAVAGIWNEASKTDPSLRKQLAPTGYHIPTDTEWTELTTFLGGANFAGGAMKETGYIHWLDDNNPATNATNSSGFTGLPGGYRYSNDTFNNIGNYGLWWSSTEYSTTNAWLCVLYYSFDFANRSNTDKVDGLSVRCLRD